MLLEKNVFIVFLIFAISKSRTFITCLVFIRVYLYILIIISFSFRLVIEYKKIYIRVFFLSFIFYYLSVFLKNVFNFFLR